MDIRRGILCGKTGDKPDFEENCPAFDQDPEYRDTFIAERVKQSDDAVVMTREVYQEALDRQNFPLGLTAGIVVGIIGSLAWAALTIGSGIQLGFFALAVGAAVGLTIRGTGRGYTRRFGVAGGIIAVSSCVLGNFLASIGFLALEFEMNYWEALIRFDYSYLLPLMKDTFHPIDLLFYAFAWIEGYKLAFRGVKLTRF